jgi:AraC-like DNA-binding protein
MRAWAMYREQPHHGELRALVGGPLVFGAPFNRIQFPASELDLPLRGADPHLAQLARRQLELRLAAVSKQVTDLATRVRERLAAQLSEDLSLARVAKDLRVSTRTLRRRLEEAGLSFQQLRQEVRKAQAARYLAQSDESIEHIAARLGYQDPSNFRRAFRRWTGVAPSTFRARTR